MNRIKEFVLNTFLTMRKIILLFLIFLPVFLNANEPNYGLYFKSHKYMGAERTALVLNNNKPFRLNKELVLSFDMSLRNEFIFGTVFKIISDTQDVISLNFIADERNNQYPILSINDIISSVKFNLELFLKILALSPLVPSPTELSKL